jgi:hypothetical protein
MTANCNPSFDDKESCIPFTEAHSGISVSAQVEISVSSARTVVTVQARMVINRAILPAPGIVESLMVDVYEGDVGVRRDIR